MLTAERLREFFHYDETTGEFTRIKGVHGAAAGQKVGTIKEGYLIIGVDRDLHYAHRLAWLWMTGEWPKFSIDHINRKRADNRWCNLRDVPHRVNRQNQGMQKNNTSGVTGLSWDKKNKCWVVHLNFPDRTLAEKALRHCVKLRRKHFGLIEDTPR